MIRWHLPSSLLLPPVIWWPKCSHNRLHSFYVGTSNEINAVWYRFEDLQNPTASKPERWDTEDLRPSVASIVNTCFKHQFESDVSIQKCQVWWQKSMQTQLWFPNLGDEMHAFEIHSFANLITRSKARYKHWWPLNAHNSYFKRYIARTSWHSIQAQMRVLKIAKKNIKSCANGSRQDAHPSADHTAPPSVKWMDYVAIISITKTWKQSLTSSIVSLIAFGFPGRFRISALPLRPAVCRDNTAVGTYLQIDHGHAITQYALASTDDTACRCKDW